MHACMYLSLGWQCVQETGLNDPRNSFQSYILQHPEGQKNWWMKNGIYVDKSSLAHCR